MLSKLLWICVSYQDVNKCQKLFPHNSMLISSSLNIRTDPAAREKVKSKLYS